MTNNINILNSFENQIITQLKKDLSTQSNNSQIFSFITPLPKVNNPWKIIDGMKKLSTYSCFWSNQSENNWISSAGKTIELKTNAINPYIEIKEKYKKIQPMISIYSFGLNNEKPNPLCFSGFSFETKILNKQDIWHDFPNGLVTLPTYTIEHKNDKTTLTINISIKGTNANKTIEKIISKGIEIIKNTLINNTKKEDFPEKKLNPVQEKEDTFIKKEWNRGVKKILDEIENNKVEKVVLCRPVLYNSSTPINTTNILEILDKKYPSCSIFSFRRGNKEFLGATPEVVLQLENNNLTSKIVAGTNADDNSEILNKNSRTNLLEDEKNLHEHNLVVKWILKKLRHLTTKLHIEKKLHIIKLQHIQHLVSLVKGKSKKNVTIFDLLDSLHHSPSICGIPKESALTTIKYLENFSRGWFSGNVGIIRNLNEGCFVIAIRSALIKNITATLFAGAGIVKNSIPDQEFDETQLKLKKILDAIKISL